MKISFGPSPPPVTSSNRRAGLMQAGPPRALAQVNMTSDIKFGSIQTRHMQRSETVQKRNGKKRTERGEKETGMEIAGLESLQCKTLSGSAGPRMEGKRKPKGRLGSELLSCPSAGGIRSKVKTSYLPSQVSIGCCPDSGVWGTSLVTVETCGSALGSPYCQTCSGQVVNDARAQRVHTRVSSKLPKSTTTTTTTTTATTTATTTSMNRLMLID